MLTRAFVSAIADRYRVVEPIGAGGMATVYRADDIRHQRSVAIKVLRPELAASIGADRFLREIAVTAGLRHPNILPLFDSGEADGALFYVMPFVEGETLRSRLESRGRFELAEALRIAEEVADALGYAHRRGIVHRDIKPENILLGDGHAVVADFGIAHALGAAGDVRLTTGGIAIGTPQYMSPEQADGEGVDWRADLYSLACVTYEMLAGAPPYTAPTPIAVMVKHARDPIPDLSATSPGIPRHIAEAVASALSKAPQDRPESLTAWRDALLGPSAGGRHERQRLRRPAPRPATPLVGRDPALQEAASVLATGGRLITITGTGGTGKTRFAIELFERTESQYPEFAAFVSLVSISSASDVMTFVASELGIAEAHGRTSLDAVATVIGDRRALLLLDNLEQVLDAAPEVSQLLDRCARLQVIATSRAPLKVGVEREFPLEPLALPDPAERSHERLLLAPSVALFVQRAQRALPRFALTADNAVAVASICRHLDGLPLALELAAARIRVLDPQTLLERLDHALDLLTSGDRDLPARQRTLRATIAWSHALLSPSEQRLLRRLSVFSEGWTLDAMEGVCYSSSERHSAVDDLASLVEKGLVRHLVAEGRYALLETIKAFATERAQEAGEEEMLRRARDSHYLHFAAEVEAGIRRKGQLAAMARARADAANLSAALQSLVTRAVAGDPEATQQGLRMCGHLNWYWHIVGLHLSTRSSIDALLGLVDGAPPSTARTWALLTSGMMAFFTGDTARAGREWARANEDARVLRDVEARSESAGFAALGAGLSGALEDARRHSTEATECAESHGGSFVRGLAGTVAGTVALFGGDPPRALRLLTQASAMQVASGDFEMGGVTRSYAAQVSFLTGDVAGALAGYAEALQHLERVGDRPEIARNHGEIGWVYLSAGQPGEARRSFERAIRTHEEVGSPRGVGVALRGLVAVALHDGRPESAVIIAAAADRLAERAGVVVESLMAVGVDERLEAARASIPAERLNTLVAEGHTIGLDAAIALASGPTAAAGTP